MTNANEYREKARRSRALADQTTDERARAALLAAVEHYERLARLVEDFPANIQGRSDA
jgi:hypothetical protein